MLFSNILNTNMELYIVLNQIKAPNSINYKFNSNILFLVF